MVLALVTAVLLVGCAPDGGPLDPDPSSGPATSTSGDPTPSGPGTPIVTGGPAPICSYPETGEPAKPVDPPSTDDIATSGEVVFSIETDQGTITVTGDRSKAPCALHSFESLVTQGYFDGTRCHRLVDAGGFFLQCGDPTGTGRGGPGYSFADELTGDEEYVGGTVAMANSGPDTNGSQFFMVYDDTDLPPQYTILGRMDQKSTSVVAAIASQGVDAENPPAPIDPAEITRITVG